MVFLFLRSTKFYQYDLLLTQPCMISFMKLINVEPKDNYILRIFLDDDSIVDFDVKAELEGIPCYKPLYEYALFKTVKFKNKLLTDSIQQHKNQANITELLAMPDGADIDFDPPRPA